MIQNRICAYAVCITVLLVAGCSTPPKAPTLSGYNRTAINTQPQVDLQSCKSDLSNTRILLTETARLADSASTALSQVAAQCTTTRIAPAALLQGQSAPALATPSYQRLSHEDAPSTVFVLRFPFASSAINLTDESAIALSEAAKNAKLIVIRGRTDGTKETSAEARVARERAEAVRSYLLALGVDQQRIRATYQATGDYASDNTTNEGRAQNRRAEVEVYQAAPTQRALAQLAGN